MVWSATRCAAAARPRRRRGCAAVPSAAHGADTDADGNDSDASTDESGIIDLSVSPGVYKLNVRGTVFVAHTVFSGDFEGTGTWMFEEEGEGTHAVLDWRPSVRKPVVRELSPVLRPLFRSNHAWTMRRGLESARRVLAENS